MEDIQEVVDPRLLEDQHRNKVLMAYRDVFDSVSGRMILDDLKRSFNDKTTFVGGDPYMSAFHEGRRALYLTLLDTIRQGEEVKRQNEIELGKIKNITEVVSD